jgi:uncharacterized protein YbjQ (UPF0145 family)
MPKSRTKTWQWATAQRQEKELSAMTTDRLFDKIRNRVGETTELRENAARARMSALNEKLERQLASQAMTPEVLAKACSL